MFEDFWKLYPRKQAKKDALKAWLSLSVIQQIKALQQIPLHAKCWCAECRQSHYIPLPASWLRGERFEDELQMPEVQQSAWWTSDEATMAFGRSKGIPAKPGMSMNDYRTHLRAAA